MKEEEYEDDEEESENARFNVILTKLKEQQHSKEKRVPKCRAKRHIQREKMKENTKN